ncbi:MAG: phosphoribosylamine--glycine ligase [Candidatus Melainabacteria bacterium]|nr:phosphoribosylamine--glycine ligase [Candidatus Melainabacteria bacterium]
MKVLVIGGGGREHALCWKLAQSPLAEAIYCTPGNGGTAKTPKVSNVNIDVMDFAQLCEFALGSAIDLVVVGPDNPLAGGIVDFLSNKGLKVFGPTKESSRLEWSKAYAKDFMSAHGIPTARYAVCNSFEMGAEIVAESPWARVVKVDGLALGKGVFVCQTDEEVLEALSHIFHKQRFGQAGEKVILEERLHGLEVSLLAFCDGRRLVPLIPSQDHKQRFSDDRGPNTGGMGAYAPAEFYGHCQADVESKVLEPIQQALEAGDLVYQGILYVGLMLTRQSCPNDNPEVPPGPYQPYVLEFNARFGDPETQAILPLMTSDLLPVLWACTEGALNKVKIEWSSLCSCCVVACAKDYPEGISSGEPIVVGALPDEVIVYHAGTKLTDGQLVTNGGRVLALTGLGSSMDLARERAYQALKAISFAGMDYRQDIGKRASHACQLG